jgi:hypothetical protein
MKISTKNVKYVYQNIQSQGLPKYTKIRMFGKKIYVPSGSHVSRKDLLTVEPHVNLVLTIIENKYLKREDRTLRY